MRNHFFKKACNAVVINGEIRMHSPNGEELGMEFRCRVTDAVGEPATFIMTGVCNIFSSTAEMYEKLGIIDKAVIERLKTNIQEYEQTQETKEA